MSSSDPNNNNRNDGGGGYSSSSHDHPIPLFQPFSASELDHDEATSTSSSCFVYHYNSPYSHCGTTIAADFGCLSSFFDTQSSSTTMTTPSSTPNYLPSLDQFGPFPSSSPPVLHTPPQSCPLPEASGNLRPDGDGAVTLLTPPPSGVALVTPLSAVREDGEVAPTVLASAAPSELETTTPSSAVSEAVPADSPPVSGGATVVVTSPQPPPPSNEAVAIPSLPTKRKRGRPRKYFPEASSTTGQEGRAPSTAQAPAAAEAASQAQVQEAADASSKSKSVKQGIASSSKGKMEVSPSVLINKTSTTWGLGSKRNVIKPATIIVSEMEDVSEKIISFARDNGAVFILAASGVLSYVELLQPSESAVSIFMGRFDILSLSGTLLLSKNALSKSGHLTISVTQLDRRVLGGRVHGRLIAASPIQIIGGIIAPAGKMTSKPSQFEADQVLQLNKQIRSMSQEWQARLDEQKQEAEEAIQRLETTTKELNETRQQLNETRQQLNETRQHVATTQNLVMQLFERLNIVNPPPQPPQF